jgi:hypothetical protein
MNESIEPEKLKSSRGKLLSNRFESASREASAEARWLDIWVENPVEAVGHIFDIGNSQSQGAEATAIQKFVFSKDPVIDVNDFIFACIEWLNSGPHDMYQYRTLLNSLLQGDTCLVPEVLEWYIKNVDNLRKAFSYPESYDPLIEMIEFLATGKTLKEHREWWMNRVRSNIKKEKRIKRDLKDIALSKLDI